MYYDEFFPFYAAYADPLLYERENIQEKEFALMKSWYPESVRRRGRILYRDRSGKCPQAAGKGGTGMSASGL